MRRGDVPVAGDFTGDGRTDLAVWRPSNGTWYVRGQASVAWGQPRRHPGAGDFTGDGRTDLAVLRPSNGTWYVRGQASVGGGAAATSPSPATSPATAGPISPYGARPTAPGTSAASAAVAVGQPGDIPVAGDFTGDGRTDLTTWRPSDGTWHVRGQASVQWGNTGDDPVAGDFTGDGRTDLTTWRPSDGTWHVRGQASVQWGRSGDIPV